MKPQTPADSMKWLVRGASLLIVALILFLLFRAFFSSALSCAARLDTIGYVDEDERSRAPKVVRQEDWGLSDSAYDYVFPDLVEPTLPPENE